MRYNSKIPKPIERMKVPPSDRGKKHYWGTPLSDYGLYETEDLQYIRRAKSSLKDDPSLRA